MKDMYKQIILVSLAFVLIASTTCFALPTVGVAKRKANAPSRKAAECFPATSSVFLEVNNVRAYIESSGSMWFRNSVPQYFIPKNGQASSMFASALWIGGVDASGQLKLAALKFRQSGDDFWPGPLDPTTATTDQQTCALYDRHFRMKKDWAYEHSIKQAEPSKYPEYVMRKEIAEWPGNPINGDTNKSWFIAPYFDVDGDGSYNPEAGDYPWYDFNNDLCPWIPQNRALAARDSLPKTYEELHDPLRFKGGVLADQVLKGDETIWWIMNDKGAKHGETQSTPIGLEIRAQAFGFSTADELNNMTFYSYEIINRSSYTLKETYFSQWVDADLGDPKDDYVGCDVSRGLGYCYNGKTVDGTGLVSHYGPNPPAVGVDFFQGPYLDPDYQDNPSFKGDNLHGPSFSHPLNYGDPNNPDVACQIVRMAKDGVSPLFTWDSVNVKNEKDTIRGVQRNVAVRAEAINGVNFGDGIVDNERFGMRRFVYHENDRSNIGDPDKAVEYYNMLRGIWRDNRRMRFGGNGHSGTLDVECDFMFPGDSDPCNWGTGGVPTSKWTEETESNPPGDRRFMQSAGPFTLQAGAVNYITVGIPWARAVGAPWASVELLKLVDDKAQLLFESCFVRLEGPDAPSLVFREMDGQLICYIENHEGSNNYKEQYSKIDYSISKVRIQDSLVTDTIVVHTYDVGAMGDTTYRDTTIYRERTVKNNIEYTDEQRSYIFEGYKVYQLLDNTVSSGELNDETKAQLVFQCDVQNGISTITNFLYDQRMQQEVPVVCVQGADDGIRHSFVITEDKFAGTRLVNYQKYYYKVVAYAYNNYLTYKVDADNPGALFGQKKAYLQGDRNADILYTAIPHKPSVQENGLQLRAEFGSQPQIIQYEGQGNGGNAVELTQETFKRIRDNGSTDTLVFEAGKGPITVEVVDPLKVKGHTYRLRFFNPQDSANTTNIGVTKDTKWELTYKKEDDVDTVIYSDTSISIFNQQLLLDLGIAITVHDARFLALENVVQDDGKNKANNQSLVGYYAFSTVKYLASSVTYQNSYRRWLSGVADLDGTYMDWIKNGTALGGGDPRLSTPRDIVEVRKDANYYLIKNGTYDFLTTGNGLIFLDREQQFSGVAGGIFTPYALTSRFHNNPRFGYIGRDDTPLDEERKEFEPHMTELYSVDIVLTSDTNLWTRCPVIETGYDPTMTTNAATRFALRKSPSVWCNGQPLGNGDEGMGWFPGYVICIETGERLNVAFGENSMYTNQNGSDMLFNPTDVTARTSDGQYIAGGGHYLYVFGHRTLYNFSSISNYNMNISDALSNDVCPSYMQEINGTPDRGAWLKGKLASYATNTGLQTRLFQNAMWTAIPLSVPKTTWLEPGNDVTIKLRVSRPYRQWRSTQSVGVKTPANGNMPLYEFSTEGLTPLYNQKDIAKSQMDSIFVVPNPYYGIATKGYEATQYDTKVKIVNLPPYCTIKIYSLDGTLIRTLNKDSRGEQVYEKETVVAGHERFGHYKGTTASVEWDLKNSANIPIASGTYLIHIRNEVYKTETTLKFLCVQRPVDVNAF